MNIFLHIQCDKWNPMLLKQVQWRIHFWCGLVNVFMEVLPIIGFYCLFKQDYANDVAVVLSEFKGLRSETWSHIFYLRSCWWKDPEMILPSLWTNIRSSCKLRVILIKVLDLKAYSQVADAFYDFQPFIAKHVYFKHRNEKIHAEISARAKHMERILQVLQRKKSTTSWNSEFVPSSLKRYYNTLDHWNKIMEIKNDR